METLKTFYKAYKWYILGALAVLAIYVGYNVFLLKKDMKHLMEYIDKNSQAINWKKSIQDKATANGVTYQQQLYKDVKYVMQLDTKYKGNPFLFFI